MRFVLVLGTATALVVAAGSSALAQVLPSPNETPTPNNGGWVYLAAIALTALGVLIALLVVFGYLRFAPRFQREEVETVRAPRIRPGKEAPRRPVTITGAPVVVPAPVPAGVAAGGAGPGSAPTAPAGAGAPPGSAQLAAPPPAAAPTQAPLAGGAGPGSAPSPAEPAAPAAAAPAPPAGEHKEVSLDQETFERVLAELLEKGTSRRVAEGQARRAAMIAARKKAGG